MHMMWYDYIMLAPCMYMTIQVTTDCLARDLIVFEAFLWYEITMVSLHVVAEVQLFQSDYIMDMVSLQQQDMVVVEGHDSCFFNICQVHMLHDL